MKRLDKLEVGKRYSLLDIMYYCERHPNLGYVYTLLDRELKDRESFEHPIVRPFVSDGCSCWPDRWLGIDLTECCIDHDIPYWCGLLDGSDLQNKAVADADLRRCVDQKLLSVEGIFKGWMGAVMHTGVSLFGTTAIGIPNAFWGFGRVSDKR